MGGLETKTCTLCFGGARTGPAGKHPWPHGSTPNIALVACMHTIRGLRKQGGDLLHVFIQTFHGKTQQPAAW
jgi:hypothetical protein